MQIFADEALPNTSVAPALYRQHVGAPPNFEDYLGWPPAGRPAPASAELHAGGQVLDEIARMSDNWDGYGAPAMPAETIRSARLALAQLLEQVPLPDITPNSNATISFEWDAERGVAHLEFGTEGFSFFLKRPGSEPVYMQGALDEMRPDWLGQLILERLFAVKYDALLIGDFRFAVDVQSW